MASEPIRDHRHGKEEKQKTQHGKPNEALCYCPSQAVTSDLDPDLRQHSPDERR
jgi:hypothetical protein